MKAIYTLLILALLSVSCKTDQESDTPSNDWEYESATEKEFKAAPRKVAVTKDLEPFSTNAALRFLDLNGLQIGMSIEELNAYNIKANQNLSKITVRSADGNYEAYEISKGGVAVLQLIPEGNVISQMMFVGAGSTPQNMVGVGTNYASLKHTYQKITSRIDQIDDKTYLRLADGVQLRMLTDASATEESALKDSASILHILVR
jgi:hypothetical protein